MEKPEIALQRIKNQFLQENSFSSPVEVLERVGVMQAQDFAMVKWALGLRCGCTEKDLDMEFDEAKIIRTHLLRPTWHIASAENVRWLISLSAPQIKKAMKSR